MNNDDYETILLLSASCSLDSSPKKNWVERSGGLPNYICHIARAIMKSGKSKSSAIAIAVSRVKKWASGVGNVDADTRAKAAKAVAEWERLKSKNKSKKVVSASYVTSAGVEDSYLLLTNIPSYKTDIVRMAWDAQERTRRDAWEKTHRPMEALVGDEMKATSSYYPYRWIKELWTDFILVECETAAQPAIWKIPFTVHPVTSHVEFGEPSEVKQVWVEVDHELTEEEKEYLGDILEY